MRYTVTWSDEAEQGAGSQWGSRDPEVRRVVNATVALIDSTLLQDPGEVGRPDPESDRPDLNVRLWEPEVRGRRAFVQFVVLPMDRLVEVLRVSFPSGTGLPPGS